LLNDGVKGLREPQAEPLSAAESTRLIEFARACKAAARVVTLYPNGHPAIATTLGRIAQLTSTANLSAPLKINVLVDNLMLDGRPLARGDAAIVELAALLHEHLIGELTVHAGGDVEAWRAFLLLLGRSSESVRAEGGISRLWTTMAGRHVEIREIDYAKVLRERRRGDSAGWEQVIASCLEGDAMALDDDIIRELLEAAGDSGKLADLISALETKATEAGHGISARAAALIRLLQGIVDAVKRTEPDRLDPVMRHLATAFGQLSPDMMVSVLTAESGVARASRAEGPAAPGGAESGSGIVEAVVDHMSDSAIAGFVARNALAQDSSIERVAHAFQSLVRDVDQRERLLALAHDDARSSPLGSTEGFEEVWDQVAQKMLTSYSDKPFVSDQYARELTTARTQPTDVEQVNDDPPERLSAWLGTVATNELRALDLTLVLDLLRIEERTERWGALMRPVVALLNDLFLAGDIDGAETLLAALVRETQPQATPERRQTALIAIDELVAGPMMQHVVAHLATLDEAQFTRVKAMCLSIGPVLVRPLTEALSTEERSRPRERLTAILLAFGAAARKDVERLKNSTNAAVRRTAIVLLREFGGSEALPELTELLSDKESQVQREAVRAILTIGSDQAFQILQQALTSGTAASREAIMHSLGTVRDERATPLFAFILRNVDHRGELSSIYLRAIETLGALKDPEGVPALKEALYRGEWWAPRRTALLRGAAAAALARIGSSAASEVLDEALQSGSRRVRSAVRSHVAALRRAQGVRG
jgi:hypothetical protein